MKLFALATALVLVVVSAGPATATPGGHRIRIDVLSSQADQVTGDDALIQVSGGSLDGVRVTRNGSDITSSLTADPAAHTLTGVVGSLRPGWNVIAAQQHFGATAFKLLRNFGAGPVFSGPRQYPFLCRTESAGLGQPIVDNQDHQGFGYSTPPARSPAGARIAAPRRSSTASTAQQTGSSRPCPRTAAARRT